jgi:hypothetical protein
MIMADNTPDCPDKTVRKIEFVPYHRPALADGDYTITATQKVKYTDERIAGKSIDESFPPATLKFSVLGPRFSLDPQVIEAVFPPDGSLGDHSNVLPHVVLKRSTLPWERTPEARHDANPAAFPWLALLLFHGKEKPEIRTISVHELKTAVNYPTFVGKNGEPPPDGPYLLEEFGDQDDDLLAVIDVPKTLLKTIIPTKKELAWLAHVRQTTDACGKPEGEEMAVIIGNRLPEASGMSTVHLVSVEGRYKGDTFVLSQAGDTVRLVSLKSWRFACLDRRQSFKGLLLHLNHQLLFNLEASDEIRSYLNAQSAGGAIPAALEQAFGQSGYPDLVRCPFRYRSQWSIMDGSAQYWLGKRKGSYVVHNQAGRDLGFSVPAPSAPGLAGKEQAIIDIFKANGHPLSDKATIAAIAPPSEHWWLGTEEHPACFIRAEGGRLYTYHLDPDSSSTLRLPAIGDSDTARATEEYLKMGCVPLPHSMRQGNRSVSWYHGPLTPGRNTAEDHIVLPIRTADELVRYNKTYGMFDVSYAAAWELGRLLALQSKSFSVALYRWKRTHTRMIKATEQRLAYLPFDGPSVAMELPETVRSWFERLARLEGVPFRYLVPDERMLPPESMRFFQVDGHWMECLLDGAFSIGRVLPSDHASDATHSERQSKNRSPRQISGFLLRSDVVAGWPGLLVDGYAELVPADSKQEKPVLPLLRKARLSQNVMIYLFEGLVQTVDIHMKPETLHFGVDADENQPLEFHKQLKDQEGRQAGRKETLPWRDKNKGVLDIARLAVAIEQARQATSLCAGDFALEMIERVEKVRFGTCVSSTHAKR